MEELVWQEIKGETQRNYIFPGGEKYVALNVRKLCVRPSGNHRLELHDGTKVIVKSGWLAIEIYADNWSV